MLDRCPRCDYSLQGLPADYACPECGLRYDADSTIWRRATPKSVFIGLIGFFFYGGFWMVRGAVMVSSTSTAARAIALVATTAFFGGFVWLAVYLVRLYLKGQMLAAMKDGLYIRLAKPDATFIPWSNVSRVAVTVGRKRNGAAIFLRAERKVIDTVGIFRGRTEGDRFVRIAQAY